MEKDVKNHPIPCYLCGKYQAQYDSKGGVPICAKCAEDELQEPTPKGLDTSDITPVTIPKIYHASKVKLAIDGKIVGPIKFTGVDFGFESAPWDCDGCEGGCGICDLINDAAKTPSAALPKTWQLGDHPLPKPPLGMSPWEYRDYLRVMQPNHNVYIDNLDFVPSNPANDRPFKCGPNVVVGLHSVELPEVGAKFEPKFRMYENYKSQIIPNDWSWWKREGDSITNVKEIKFPTAGTWAAPVECVSFSDEDGIVLHSGRLNNPMWVGLGTTLSFMPGTLSVQYYD